MRHFKKKTVALCLASMITVLGGFAAEQYSNTLVSLGVDNQAQGYVNLTVYTTNKITQGITTEQLNSNTYSITLPNTNNEITNIPDFTKYANIESIQISTFPYTQDSNGYTTIKVITKGETFLNATPSLYLENKSSDNKPSPKYSAIFDISSPQSTGGTSYWDAHSSDTNNNVKSADEEEHAESKPATSNNNVTVPEKTQVQNYAPPQQLYSDSSGERLPILIGICVLILLVVCIYFIGRDKMAEIVGEQKDFDIDSEDKKTNEKNAKIKNRKTTIKKIDNIYTQQSKYSPTDYQPQNISFQTSTVSTQTREEEEEAPVIVDLDSLFQEKTREKREASNIPNQNDDNTDEIDDLADLLKDFAIDEIEVAEDSNEEASNIELSDEQFYQDTINNSNIVFSSQDEQNISQLIQNEISSEAIKYAQECEEKRATLRPKVYSQQELLENLIGEYTVKQNISFTKDDVDALKKLISVELDSSFITDLRTNPQRTQAMQQELSKKRPIPHTAVVSSTLCVKDLLPDLSKELLKQGNKPIKSEWKPDIVYYSEGYEVSKLSVSNELSNITALNNITDNSFRPSDEEPITESGYDVQTFLTNEELPSITEAQAILDRQPKKSVEVKVDENSLLESLANVTFKPFYSENKTSEKNDSIEKMQQEALSKFKAESSSVKDIVLKEKIGAKPEEEKKTNLIAQRSTTNSGNEQENVPKKIEISGIQYDILKSAKCDTAITCYLSKDSSNKYVILGSINSEFKVLRRYDELKNESIHVRVHQKNSNGGIQYLIRVNNNKFLIYVADGKMEFLMDLC